MAMRALVTPEVGGQEGAKLRTRTILAGELAANGHKVRWYSASSWISCSYFSSAGSSVRAWRCSTSAARRRPRSARGGVAAFQAGEGDVFSRSAFLRKLRRLRLRTRPRPDYGIIADPWWNPAAEDQPWGRAHRIGQQRPRHGVPAHHRGHHRGTHQAELHKDKRALADGLLDAERRGGIRHRRATARRGHMQLVGLLRR
ncbi:hypothetical protein ACTMU2_23360 [Cupriavidus basilensis]